MTWHQGTMNHTAQRQHCSADKGLILSSTKSAQKCSLAKREAHPQCVLQHGFTPLVLQIWHCGKKNRASPAPALGTSTLGGGISTAFLLSLGASSPPFIYCNEIKDPSPWKRLSAKSCCTTALHPARGLWHCFLEQKL